MKPKQKYLILLTAFILFFNSPYPASAQMLTSDYAYVRGTIVVLRPDKGLMIIRNEFPPNDEVRLFSHAEKLKDFKEGQFVRVYYNRQSHTVQSMK